jgi:hypothetical protein
LDLAYLGRSLNKRTYEAGEAYGIAKARIMAEAAAKGALGSGRLLLQFEQEALAIFTEKANEAAQFTFNLAETNDGEVARQLDYCMGRMVELIMNHVVDGGSGLVRDDRIQLCVQVRQDLIVTASLPPSRGPSHQDDPGSEPHRSG